MLKNKKGEGMGKFWVAHFSENGPQKKYRAYDRRIVYQNGEFALEFLIRVGRTKKWVPAQSCLILNSLKKRKAQAY